METKITALEGYKNLTFERKEGRDYVDIKYSTDNGDDYIRICVSDIKRVLKDLDITVESPAKEGFIEECDSYKFIEECDSYKAEICLDVAGVHIEWVEKKYMGLTRFKAYVWRRIKELFRNRVNVTPHDKIEGEITIETSAEDYIDHEDFAAVWREDNLQVMGCCDLGRPYTI